jgi:hypothetical protein
MAVTGVCQCLGDAGNLRRDDDGRGWAPVNHILLK